MAGRRAAILLSTVVFFAALSFNAAIATPPSFPPGLVRGELIYYNSDHPGGPIGGLQSEIFVIASDGTGKTNLTNNPASDANPAVAPDGSAVAFVSDRTGPGYDLWLMDPDGSNPRQVTTLHSLGFSVYGRPAWSPDSKKIVFSNGVDIMIVNSDGTGLHTIVAGGLNREPAWSPDGSTIAYVSESQNREIWLVDVTGANPRPLVAIPGVAVYQPAWAPDGSKIAFTYDDPVSPSGRDIAVINVDGTGFENITSAYDSADVAPVWFPDGERIAFGSDRGSTTPGVVGGGNIWVMNADGSNPINLTADSLEDADTNPDVTLNKICPPADHSQGQGKFRARCAR